MSLKEYYKPVPARVMGGRTWACNEPGCVHFPDCPMLKDEVWDLISGDKGFRALLCIAHAEERLGRPISMEDLEDCGGNAFMFLLHDRLTQEKRKQYLMRLREHDEDED